LFINTESKCLNLRSMASVLNVSNSKGINLTEAQAMELYIQT